jgi:hypothetical protein
MNMMPSSPRATARVGEPISPRTFRQVYANRIIFARIRREGIDITGDDELVNSVSSWRACLFK